MYSGVASKAWILKTLQS